MKEAAINGVSKIVKAAAEGGEAGAGILSYLGAPYTSGQCQPFTDLFEIMTRVSRFDPAARYVLHLLINRGNKSSVVLLPHSSGGK